MLLAMKYATKVSWNNLFSRRVFPCDQTNGVYAERADNGWVQTFKIQDQYMPEQARLGIHNIAARAFFCAVTVPHVGRNPTSPMHSG